MLCGGPWTVGRGVVGASGSFGKLTGSRNPVVGLLDSYSLRIGSGWQGISIKRYFGYLWNSRATMGKVMISLTDEAEQLVREEVDKLYFGRTGGFSIFFERLIRQYFSGLTKRAGEKRLK